MKTLLALALLASALPVSAQPAPRQDLAALKPLVEQFLTAQTSALAGEVRITVREADPRMNFAACAAPQAFMPSGSRPWGRLTVGVRCAAPNWTVYIQAQVSVMAQYVAAAVPLAQGQTIEANQLVSLQGDLAALPAGVLTDPALAVGKSLSLSIQSGMPVRADALRSKPVVQQGQLVRVVSSGKGFSVSAEARAIGTASDGQIVQVRTPAGVVLSGIAKAGGLVEVGI